MKATPGEARPAGLGRDEVKTVLDAYAQTYTQAEEEVAARYAVSAHQFYNLVTDFYEFGWGSSFHFAVRRPGETMRASIARHQDFLGDKLGLRPEMTVIDLGCGVGGPLRHLARTTGARVTGININAYQVEKVRRYNRAEGLDGQCSAVEGDFLHIPFPDASFDRAYAFEATCHAPDKPSVFGEAFRVLRPGGLFAVYEWCITPRYDHDNPEHRKVRFGIEKGNCLPTLATFAQVDRGLTASGFELIESGDRASVCAPGLPWQSSLTEVSWRSLARTPAGRAVTNLVTGLLERVRVAPEGTQAVSSFLNDAADALVAGGDLGIFTPMYFALARKPER